MKNVPGKIFFKYPAKCDHAIPTAKFPAGRSWFNRTSPVKSTDNSNQKLLNLNRIQTYFDYRHMLPVKVSVRLRYTVVQDLILAFIRLTTIKNLGSKAIKRGRAHF